MSVCTLGIYEIFWFYKNWSLIKQREKSDINPFWRAVFGFFFCYQCFSHIRSEAETLGIRPTPPAGLLAIAWIITTSLWRLPDPYWLASYLAFFWLLPAQVVANKVNAQIAPNHDPNGFFGGWNIVAVVVGSVSLALIVIGLFFGSTDGAATNMTISSIVCPEGVTCS